MNIEIFFYITKKYVNYYSINKENNTPISQGRREIELTINKKDYKKEREEKLKKFMSDNSIDIHDRGKKIKEPIFKIKNKYFNKDIELWILREKGLNKTLTNDELCSVLWHYINKRGRYSNITNEYNKWKIDNKYKSISDYVVSNPEEKRDFLRNDVLYEINLLLNSQKKYKSDIVDESFIKDFLDIFNYDGSDLQSSEISDEIVKNSIKLVREIIGQFIKGDVDNVEVIIEYKYITNKEINRDRVSMNRLKGIVENITGIKASNYNLKKYYLYIQQNGICPYSGIVMDKNRIFEKGYLEIDHIIPRSKVKDNSVENLVLTFCDENQRKSNKNMVEFFEGDNELRELKGNILGMAFSYGKLTRLISQENFMNDFINENEQQWIEKDLRDLPINNVRFKTNDNLSEVSKILLLLNLDNTNDENIFYKNEVINEFGIYIAYLLSLGRKKLELLTEIFTNNNEGNFDGYSNNIKNKEPIIF